VQLVLIFSWGVPHPSVLRVRVLTLSVFANRINPNFAPPAPGVVRPTAPRPIPRMLHQLSLHRIGVHVLQFFLQFLLAPHVEIIKSPLPKMRLFCVTALERQRQLCARRPSSSFQESPRHLLLQYLQYLRWIFLGGLADQQMHMFRHHDISNEAERMPAANFIQDFHEAVSRPRRTKKRPPSITTESNEMQVALSVMTFERIAHRGKLKPAPLNPKGAAPPHTPSMKCGSGMLIQCATVKKKKLSLRHPPTTIQGTGGLAGFTFNFTYSNWAGNVTAGGTFTYNGNYAEAESALGRAGFQHYASDEYDIFHPSSLSYYAYDYRSPGEDGTGAGSGHFTVDEPWANFPWQSSIGHGDVHLGEHNDNTPGGFLPHTGEVLRTLWWNYMVPK